MLTFIYASWRNNNMTKRNLTFSRSTIMIMSRRYQKSMKRTTKNNEKRTPQNDQLDFRYVHR